MIKSSRGNFPPKLKDQLQFESGCIKKKLCTVCEHRELERTKQKRGWHVMMMSYRLRCIVPSIDIWLATLRAGFSCFPSNVVVSSGFPLHAHQKLIMHTPALYQVLTLSRCHRDLQSEPMHVYLMSNSFWKVWTRGLRINMYNVSTPN